MIKSKILIFLALFGFFVSTAQVSQALTVSPLRVEYTVGPGETVGGNFELYNDESKETTYEMSFANFEARDESGNPQFVSDVSGLASWITSVRQVTLKKSERINIDYTIIVPANAEPGGYFAGVLVKSAVSRDDLGEGTVAVESQVGTLILLRVKGDIQESGDLLEFATQDKKSFFTGLPISFFFRFQNQGQDWVRPLGDIVITNIFGKAVKIIPANSFGDNILPDSVRRFGVTWWQAGKPETQGDGEAVSVPEGFWNKVKYEWKNFVFGFYKANLTITFGQQQNRVSRESNFFVFPWHLMSVVTGAVILQLILIFRHNLISRFKRPRSSK